MTWQQRALIFLFLGIVFSVIGACAARSTTQDASVQNSSEDTEAGVMGIILAESARFKSVTVTVTGVFQGWRGPCPGGPPVSRSDWMIADASGCLYVHGPLPPGLDPAKPAREKISVTGVVRLKKGRPYIDSSAKEKK